MAVALLALFVALGGVSYGVTSGSIGSRAIKDNTVRSEDIRNNTVRSGDVRNGSLRASDFKAGQLPAGPAGATGATGDKGDPGTPGSPGRDGTDGVSGYVDATPGIVNASIPAETSTTGIFANCPAGTRAVGGGFSFLNTSATAVEDFQVLLSQRGSNQAQWQVVVRNTNDTLARTLDARVTAVCVQG